MLEGVGTLPVLLDEKLTVKPPVKAGADSVTVTVVDPPSPIVGLLSVIAPTVVTEAVALVMPAALAVIVTGPPATTPVTVTLAEVVPAIIVTDDGTVAIPVLLEARLTTKPPVGASPPVKFRASVSVPPPAVTLDDAGERVIVGAPTVTVPVADAVIEVPFQLEIEAVIVDVPIAWP